MQMHSDVFAGWEYPALEQLVPTQHDHFVLYDRLTFLFSPILCRSMLFRTWLRKKKGLHLYSSTEVVAVNYMRE